MHRVLERNRWGLQNMSKRLQPCQLCMCGEHTFPDIVADRQPNAIADRQPNAVADRQPNAIADRHPNVIADRQPNVIADRQPNSSGACFWLMDGYAIAHQSMEEYHQKGYYLRQKHGCLVNQLYAQQVLPNKLWK
jgi:hypothetical protein